MRCTGRGGGRCCPTWPECLPRFHQDVERSVGSYNEGGDEGEGEDRIHMQCNAQSRVLLAGLGIWVVQGTFQDGIAFFMQLLRSALYSMLRLRPFSLG